ncbi:hypothetical protein HBH92_226840 [Parastagonospora nodorum]|nr:hypothetical protein HBH92_226840 [Parastagonospora nodorum]KAH4405471.1 hypothetical protein HBH93_232300 [Parastagonospora nodorum]KAH4430295.1 hypothetical protein HBH91_237820 [Parastagonospora nodorum]KAH4485747.1 hypothetical protein HBH89_216600 [Parastagonospora nodorum]KAH4526250.1 hypothetical protein HBH86_231660 [Parastagonospora nodorum]
MNIVSNKSERGSEVPTPIATSCTVACSPRITTVDGDTITTTTSFTDSDTTTVSSFVDTIHLTSTFNSADDTVYPTSTVSSFEEVSTPITEINSVATEGSACANSVIINGSVVPSETMVASPLVGIVHRACFNMATPRPILGSIAKAENRIMVVKDEAIWSHSSSHLGSSRCKYFMVSEW